MDTDEPAQFEFEARTQSDLIWGVDAIASVINRTPRQTNHMLASGHIGVAQKIGNRWVASREALLSFLRVKP